jgi:hypothetical protein
VVVSHDSGCTKIKNTSENVKSTLRNEHNQTSCPCSYHENRVLHTNEGDLDILDFDTQNPFK